jgi:pimeloyl-ACP methyl ester carboxylesterase
VLIIPGLDGSAGLWRAAAARVFGSLRPIIFDHSQDRAAGGLEGLADRALRLLDADDDSNLPAYVCGESFGGTVALTLARRRPNRVRGLLLMSTFGYYPSSRIGRAGMALWKLLGDRLTDGLFKLAHPLTVPGAVGFGFKGELGPYLRRSATDPAAVRQKCELSLGFDARGWLHEIQQPTFVLTGSFDPVVPPAASSLLAQHIPHSSLHRVRGGHLVWSVNPTEVGALVNNWLAQT